MNFLKKKLKNKEEVSNRKKIKKHKKKLSEYNFAPSLKDFGWPRAESNMQVDFRTKN